MAVKTVTGKLTTPDNVNVAAALVQARLSAQAVVASTNEVAPGVVSTLTAADGSWSLSLQSNLDLTPNTTYYTISVGNLWTATVVVPSSAGPFKIEDVMAAPPAVSPPAALDSLVVHLANTETITGVKSFVGPAPTSPNGGRINLGDGAFDGSTPGFFVGAAAGTMLALNLASGSTQHMVDFQVAGASKFGIDQLGQATFFALSTFKQSAAFVFDSTVNQQFAVQVQNQQAASRGPVNGYTSISLPLGSQAHYYDALVDWNTGIKIDLWGANDTGISVGNNGDGDGIYVQQLDDSQTTTSLPGNALNIYSGLQTMQTTTSGSGGTVTYGATTLTDSSQSWTVNQWASNGAGYGRWVVAGTARMLVTSNTATTLTGTGGWVTSVAVGGPTNLEQVAASTPGAGTAYSIAQPNGTGVKIQSWGNGFGLLAIGQAGNGGNDLVRLQQAANGRTIGILSDTGSTTADTIGLTFTAKTSGNVFNIFHNASTFTGAGLLMRFAQGSGAFTGKFEDYQVNSVSKWSVDSGGVATSAGGFVASAAATGISNTGGDVVLNAKAASNMLFQVGGATQAFMGNNGILKVVNAGGLDGSGAAQTVNIGTVNANVLNLGNSTSLVNFNYAVTALGGGAAPTFGTIGGSGPATAAQNSWLKVNVNGTASYVPVWR